MNAVTNSLLITFSLTISYFAHSAQSEQTSCQQPHRLTLLSDAAQTLRDCRIRTHARWSVDEQSRTVYASDGTLYCTFTPPACSDPEQVCADVEFSIKIPSDLAVPITSIQNATTLTQEFIFQNKALDDLSYHAARHFVSHLIILKFNV